MGIKETLKQLAGHGGDRQKALGEALATLERQFGKGAVMCLGDAEPEPVDTISTGSLGLDLALGVGGYPRGRIVEIYGPESSGKTTLTLHAIAEAQAAGGVAAFIDAEHAFDPIYARGLGVRIEELLVSQPDTGEQGLEICETLVRSGAVDVVVIDSVAALVPRAEIEGEMGDSHVGLQARLMSQALRKLAGVVLKNKTTVLFINQIRMKIGVMFGSPETTTGGNALKFYASQRLDIRRIGAVKDGDKVIGNRTRVKVVKNKVAPPFTQVEFDIRYGAGVDRLGEILDLGVLHGVVEKSGAWYAAEGERLGQGREKSIAALAEDPARTRRLMDAILAATAAAAAAAPTRHPAPGAAPGAGTARRPPTSPRTSPPTSPPTGPPDPRASPTSGPPDHRGVTGWGSAARSGAPRSPGRPRPSPSLGGPMEPQSLPFPRPARPRPGGLAPSAPAPTLPASGTGPRRPPGAGAPPDARTPGHPAPSPGAGAGHLAGGPGGVRRAARPLPPGGHPAPHRGPGPGPRPGPRRPGGLGGPLRPGSFVAGRVEVQDFGSTNGTWLDGRRVAHGVARDGSTLELGETVLRLFLRTRSRVAFERARLHLGLWQGGRDPDTRLRHGGALNRDPDPRLRRRRAGRAAPSTWPSSTCSG